MGKNVFVLPSIDKLVFDWEDNDTRGPLKCNCCGKVSERMLVTAITFIEGNDHVMAFCTEFCKNEVAKSPVGNEFFISGLVKSIRGYLKIFGLIQPLLNKKFLIDGHETELED